jgi:hypothetical protein
LAEYCIVWVESDGWAFKEMEPVFEDLEAARRAAQDRLSSGFPVLGVVERESSKLVWRSDGETLDIPRKFQVWPTD